MVKKWNLLYQNTGFIFVSRLSCKSSTLCTLWKLFEIGRVRKSWIQLFFTVLPAKPGHEYFDAAKMTCRCLFCRIMASYAQACFAAPGPFCPATSRSDQTNLYSSTLSALTCVCIQGYFPPKIVPCDELCRLSCLWMLGRFRGGGGGGLLQKKQSLLLSLSSSPTLAYNLPGLLWRLYESSSSSFSYSVSSLLSFRSSFFSSSTSTSSCWQLDPITYWSLEFCLAFNIKESVISFKNCISCFKDSYRRNTMANKTFMNWYSRKAVKFTPSVKSFLNIY